VPLAKLNTERADIEGLKNAKISRISSKSKIASLDLDTDEEYLYVLFSGKPGDYSGKYIDIYDKNNGKYIKSINLSSAGMASSDIEIDSGNLYLMMYDESIESHIISIISLL
jgi:hypothetical protein